MGFFLPFLRHLRLLARMFLTSSTTALLYVSCLLTLFVSSASNTCVDVTVNVILMIVFLSEVLNQKISMGFVGVWQYTAFIRLSFLGFMNQNSYQFLAAWCHDKSITTLICVIDKIISLRLLALQIGLLTFFLFQDGTWSTIKGSCVVVQDFTDFCFHSYFSYMDELMEQMPADEKPMDIE